MQCLYLPLHTQMVRIKKKQHTHVANKCNSGCVHTVLYMQISIHCMIYFYGGTLTTNCQPLTVRLFVLQGLLINNFMLDRTTWLSAMYFSVSFDGSIVTHMFLSRCFGLSRPSLVLVCALLGLLQYQCILCMLRFSFPSLAEVRIRNEMRSRIQRVQ